MSDNDAPDVIYLLCRTNVKDGMQECNLDVLYNQGEENEQIERSWIVADINEILDDLSDDYFVVSTNVNNITQYLYTTIMLQKYIK